MENVKWVEPTNAASPADSGNQSTVLSEADVHSWREYGYCLVNGVLPNELLRRLVNDCNSIFPPPLSEEAKNVIEFGGLMNFPSKFNSVNELTLHPRILTAVRQLFGLPDVHDVSIIIYF